ncbi:hypothetical protein C4569_00330 [Candidatus Parcubacteria bacterium]|nr:MAG: hypothetical protein C4569_00330 [Candidatus Parcubacteria bacterium]
MKKILFTMIIALLLNGCSLLPPQKQVSIENENKNQSDTPKTKKLDLSNQNLQKIPEYVFNRTSLEELDVSNNQLTGAVQAEIRHLQNLKILDMSNNQMTGVPAEIGQLQNLQVLDLSNNKLTGLPYELGNLKNLRTLDISGNDYSETDLGIIQKELPKDAKIIR